MISGDGLEMDEKKIEAITKITAPTTAAKLNSFVCMAQYYREFIKGFTTIVKPLRDLIAADKYVWAPIHQSAFDRVKDELLKKVILAHPYPDKPFVLECDASNYGLGFILSQRDDNGRLRVVAFGSRALTSQERNYSATERECLAVLEGIKKYHIYLHGTYFTVITNHKALVWLMTHKDPNSKLMRWALKIQQYQFVIEHRASAKHANADALSRLVEEEPRDKTIVSNMVAAVSIPEDEDLPKAQWEDKALRPIIAFLKTKKLPKDEAKAKAVVGQAQHMELVKGVLYHIWWPQNKRYWGDTRQQIAIPISWRKRILQECHNSPLTGGHLRFTRTHIKIRERYWWPNLYSETKEYVAHCLACQQRKGNQPVNAGEPTAIITDEPWETVGVDIFGPLRPKTLKGNKYIITFTDFTTKYVVARPLFAANEEESALALVEDVICKYGVMRKLVSDRGSNFVSSLITEVYKVLKIHKINTTAWHPQGNGQTERFNRPLANMLSIYVKKLKKDWDDVLTYVIFAYNTSVHETTKFTPYFLMFGREPRFPLEIALGPTSTTAVGGYSAYAEEMSERFRAAYSLAKDNAQLAQHKSEVRTAKTRTPVTYQVGDKVWLYVKPRTVKNSASAKLQMPWQGPYTVLKQVSPNTVTLKGISGRLGQNVHVSRLKTYKEARPETDPELDEDDTFNPETERALNLQEIDKNEALPEEEQIPEEISSFRVNASADLEFWTTWQNGDRSWEPEINLEGCDALEQYYRSRRTEPFFGLKIHFTRYAKLFAKKGYSFRVAIEQICASVVRFCIANSQQAELITTTRALSSIGEIREFVEDFLENFKDKTNKLRSLQTTTD